MKKTIQNIIKLVQDILPKKEKIFHWFMIHSVFFVSSFYINYFKYLIFCSYVTKKKKKKKKEKNLYIYIYNKKFFLEANNYNNNNNDLNNNSL